VKNFLKMVIVAYRVLCEESNAVTNAKKSCSRKNLRRFSTFAEILKKYCSKIEINVKFNQIVYFARGSHALSSITSFIFKDINLTHCSTFFDSAKTIFQIFCNSENFREQESTKSSRHATILNPTKQLDP